VNRSIEAAWIAGSSGFLVGVTGTAIIARIGFKSTRAATATGGRGELDHHAIFRGLCASHR
jgi:hypothetical protein